MKLHWSPKSPFVRKVMIVLHETGQLDRVERVRSVVAMSTPPNPAVLADNPLGKIPTLVLDDGTALFDSRVITEYLDTLHGGRRLFPQEPQERFRQLRWAALGDGLTDVLLLWRNERLREEGQSEVLKANFATKVKAAMALLEAEAGALSATPFGIGQIAIVCALGQLDFRFADSGWRGLHPALADWYAEMEQRPSVHLTRIEDDAPAIPGSGVELSYAGLFG